MIILGAYLYGCAPIDPLFVPNKNDLKVIWCDEKFVYCEAYNKKIVKIRNIDEDLLFVGDYLIEK